MFIRLFFAALGRQACAFMLYSDRSSGSEALGRQAQRARRLAREAPSAQLLKAKSARRPHINCKYDIDHRI